MLCSALHVVTGEKRCHVGQVVRQDVFEYVDE